MTHKGNEFVGDGSWQHCLKLTDKLFVDAPCPHAGGCSFGGTFQPKLPSTFYGFSYMYDRTAAIGLIDGKPKMYRRRALLAPRLGEVG